MVEAVAHLACVNGFLKTLDLATSNRDGLILLLSLDHRNYTEKGNKKYHKIQLKLKIKDLKENHLLRESVRKEKFQRGLVDQRACEQPF